MISLGEGGQPESPGKPSNGFAAMPVRSPGAGDGFSCGDGCAGYLSGECIALRQARRIVAALPCSTI
jgi:hypothetical protein